MIAAIAAIPANAAGMILFRDSFDGDELTEGDWIVENNNFYVDAGKLVGDPSAVVCQTDFRWEEGEVGNLRSWKHCSVKIDVRITDWDEATENNTGLWWKDYTYT